LSGGTVQAYGIGCILTAGLVFSSLNSIDYAGASCERTSWTC
jgi:hypothetical protein